MSFSFSIVVFLFHNCVQLHQNFGKYYIFWNTFTTYTAKQFAEGSLSMDAKDHLLLDALKEDASLSVAKLALKTNLPATTVYNRIKKLKAHGIIKNYTINIDKNLVYGSIVGFILIKAKSDDLDQRLIVQELMKQPMVENAAIITGEKDIFVRIRVKSIEELNSFILDKLRKVPGIQDSTTMISLETFEK